MRIRFFAAIVLTCAVSFCHAQALVIYPAITVLPQSPAFTVKARIPGQPWKELPVYLVTVADGTQPKFVSRPTSVAWFDFSGTVVRVHSGSDKPPSLPAPPAPAPAAAAPPTPQPAQSAANQNSGAAQ